MKETFVFCVHVVNMSSKAFENHKTAAVCIKVQLISTHNSKHLQTTKISFMG